jgi:hypothetical protein
MLLNQINQRKHKTENQTHCTRNFWVNYPWKNPKGKTRSVRFIIIILGSRPGKMAHLRNTKTTDSQALQTSRSVLRSCWLIALSLAAPLLLSSAPAPHTWMNVLVHPIIESSLSHSVCICCVSSSHLLRKLVRKDKSETLSWVNERISPSH